MVKKMKVSTKLILGFGILLVMLLIVAVFSLLGLNWATTSFNSYRALAIENNQSGRVQAMLLEARIAVKNYIESGQKEFINEYKNKSTKMNTFLKETEKLVNSQQRAEMIDTMKSKFETYDNTFSRVIELMNKRDEIVYNLIYLRGANLNKHLEFIMKKAYDTGETEQAYYAGLVLANVLRGRLYVTKYLDSNKLEELEKAREFMSGNSVKTNMNNLDSNIQGEERRKSFVETKQEIQQYLKELKDLEKTITERNNLIDNTLDKIGPEIAQIIEDSKLSVKAEQDKLGPQVKANNELIMLIVSILTIAALIISIVITVIITTSINKTLGGEPYFIAYITKNIAEGELDIKELVNYNKQKRGLLLDVAFMVDALKEKSGQIETIAEGDLTVDVKLASTRDEVGTSLKKMVRSLNEILGQINNAIDQINTGTDQLSSSSEALSQGATRQAASLEEVSASISEISSQVQENTENAVKSSEEAKEARSNAEKGNEQMKTLVLAMNEINQSAQDIKDIVKVIDDIAFQTNLLALNADIEAARVGKYGKGFAVVANSVRNLAAKSGKSVKETTVLVDKAIKNIERGNDLVERTAKQLGDIVIRATEVTNLANEVAEASQEQARSIEQISTALDQVEDVVQSNSANAEENASTSEELASQTQHLYEMINRFKIKQFNRNLPGGYDDRGLVPYEDK